MIHSSYAIYFMMHRLGTKKPSHFPLPSCMGSANTTVTILEAGGREQRVFQGILVQSYTLCVPKLRLRWPFYEQMSSRMVFLAFPWYLHLVHIILEMVCSTLRDLRLSEYSLNVLKVVFSESCCLLEI